MGFGEVAAFQIEGKVEMAQAGLITEAEARQQSESLLNYLSPADRQEALAVLSQKAKTF